MLLPIWACFYGSGATLEGGRSTESGGDVGDAAEVTEISKKKYKKKTYLEPKQCCWTSFGLVLCL